MGALISKNVKTILKTKTTYLTLLLVSFLLFSLWPIGSKPRTFAMTQWSFLSTAIMFFMISSVVLFGDFFIVFSIKKNDGFSNSLISFLNKRNAFFSRLFTTFVVSYFFESSALFIIWMILQGFKEKIALQTVLISFVTVPLFGLAIIEIFGLLYVLIRNKKVLQIASIGTLSLAIVQCYNKPLNLLDLPFIVSTLIVLSIDSILYFITLEIYKKMEKRR